MIKFKIFPEDTKLEDLQKEWPYIQIVSADNPQVAFAELGVRPYPLNSRTPVMLIKFGEKRFMEKLLFDGEVYMQTTNYFSELENGNKDCSDGRGDAYEGVDVVLHADEITFDGISIKNQSSIRGKYSNNNDGLVFSTFGVFDTSQREGSLVFSDEMKKMGNAAVVIYDPMIFVDRCTRVTKKLGGVLMADSVTYYNENAGDYKICPWLKRKKFEFQSEYRLFIPCRNTAPLILRLGSIEDIAEIITW